MSTTTPTPNAATDWGSFEPQVVKETATHRVIAWQQSAGRRLSWVEAK